MKVFVETQGILSLKTRSRNQKVFLIEFDNGGLPTIFRTIPIIEKLMHKLIHLIEY